MEQVGFCKLLCFSVSINIVQDVIFKQPTNQFCKNVTGKF